MKRRAAAVVVVATLLVSGCGRAADQTAVQATVLAFLQAYAKGDVETACTLLTARGRRTLFRSRSVDECRRRVRFQLANVAKSRLRLIETAHVNKIDFDGKTRANVYVGFRGGSSTPQAPLGVVKRGDQWFVDGATFYAR